VLLIFDYIPRCIQRDGEVVAKHRNVPMRYGTNLCKQSPVIPSRCTNKQGMLMNLQGQPVQSLYAGNVLVHRDQVVSAQGAGLFIQGGNPIYYTSKGTAEDVARQVQAVMRGHLDDLAGHHIVLRVHNEEWSGDTFMHVHATPLLAPEFDSTASTDAARNAFIGSLRSTRLTWENLDGWLYNLAGTFIIFDTAHRTSLKFLFAGTMRTEQIRHEVDRLYPQTASKQHSSRWSCPLRRLSFWSKVTQSFSPLVPSPARSARLFGAPDYNMLHGTRSHPTQLFASLYNKLANVVTSNGFCFCVSWQDCQVQSSSECSLIDTIKSMYDGKYRTTRLLPSVKDKVCTQQLDWPFSGGIMRDGSVSVPRYSAPQVPTSDGTCNVLDRIPPFQYRYMPVGKVTKPSDGKTSLSEGGSCHMGRGARLPPTLSISTKMCRKIYSNHTHVVARCFEGDLQTVSFYIISFVEST
jgi:hypothetical protein